MENHSRRIAHGDGRPACTPSSREQRSSFFQGFLRGSSTTHIYVTFFTSLIFVEVVELYTLHGEQPPAIFNFQAQA